MDRDVQSALQVVTDKRRVGATQASPDNRDVVEPSAKPPSSSPGATPGTEGSAVVPHIPSDGFPVLKEDRPSQAQAKQQRADAAKQADRDKRVRALGGSVAGILLLL